jgi:hypothetical protein
MLKFENKSNGRYYYIYIQRDMLNDHVLTILRGGKNARICRNIIVSDSGCIDEKVKYLTRLRLKRGYTLVC